MRLRVLEVIEKSWWRSQLRVEADADGELFFGHFTPVTRTAPRFKGQRYRLSSGQQLHLVCYGGDWRIGDDVPADKIVYRYEP